MRIRIKYRYKTDETFDIIKTVEKFEYIFNISGFSTDISDHTLYFNYRYNNMPTRKDIFENALEFLKKGSVRFELKEGMLNIYWSINLYVSIIRSTVLGLIGALVYYFYIEDVLLNSIFLFSSIWFIVFIVSLFLIKLKTIYFNHSVL
jgi:hypothetical protein